MFLRPPSSGPPARAFHPRPGNEAGFSEVVREHQAMVFSIGWHLLGDAAAAEELAQDVFLRLFEHWDAIASREHVKHWLRRVMTQRAIDYSRRAKLRPRFGLEAAPEPWIPAAEQDPLASQKLAALITRLPERARRIVVLRYQEDMEPAEIAELLGLSTGAVKSNLHRSLQWLRLRMERRGAGRGRAERKGVTT
jgi:RNA polymerase sigma-70 factor (ECF subfamily)